MKIFPPSPRSTPRGRGSRRAGRQDGRSRIRSFPRPRRRPGRAPRPRRALRRCAPGLCTRARRSPPCPGDNRSGGSPPRKPPRRSRRRAEPPCRRSGWARPPPKGLSCRGCSPPRGRYWSRLLRPSGVSPRIGSKGGSRGEFSRGSALGGLDDEPVLAPLEDRTHLGGEVLHEIQDGLSLAILGELHPGVGQDDREELQALEVPALHRDAKQEGAVVAQVGVHGVVVYKVAGVVQDRLPPV